MTCFESCCEKRSKIEEQLFTDRQSTHHLQQNIRQRRLLYPRSSYDVEMDRMMRVVERTSLVRFTDRDKGLNLLKRSIKSADEIASQAKYLDQAIVKPLTSLWQSDEWMRHQSQVLLRDDVPEPQDRNAVMRNSTIVTEDYFQAPADHRSD